ncbi:hypothetical protein BDV12DRAFT_187018 [Aspergillus spectabilis]
MAELTTFAAQHPHIECITPSSENFDSLRSVYAHPEISPSAILRPSTVQDVGTIISFFARTRTSFTVRGGRHDLQGRSTKNDTSARYGLGVDQIVGAKVVNANGEVLVADEELLKAIRGAGGAFGVVVEVTMKIYKLDKGYRALTDEGLLAPLSVHQCVLAIPVPNFALLFVWVSTDLEAREKWLQKIAGLAPVIAKTSQPLPMAASTQLLRGRSPTRWLESSPTTQRTCHPIPISSTTSISSGAACRLQDRTRIRFSLSGKVILCFEITALVQNKDNLEAAMAWGREFQEALQKTNTDNIVLASYVPFLTPEEMDHAKVYGEHLPFLRELKKRLDPENIFKAAISYL